MRINQLNTVKGRLKFFIESENLNIKGFEQRISASNGYVNSISKSIGGDKLRAINRVFPNLNIDWLLTGEGEMLLPESVGKTTKNENETMRRRFLEERVEDLEKQVVELSSENSELSQITQNLLGRVQELEKGISGQKDNKRKPSDD